MKNLIIIFLFIFISSCSTIIKKNINKKPVSELSECIQQIINDTYEIYNIPMSIIEKHCINYLNHGGI
jgi:hypothetical protein